MSGAIARFHIDDKGIVSRLPLFYECALAFYTSAFGALPEPERRMRTYLFKDRRQYILLHALRGIAERLVRLGNLLRTTQQTAKGAEKQTKRQGAAHISSPRKRIHAPTIAIQLSHVHILCLQMSWREPSADGQN